MGVPVLRQPEKLKYVVKLEGSMRWWYLFQVRITKNSMSYRSTWKNRHFGARFTSVGGVEAEILMS